MHARQSAPAIQNPAAQSTEGHQHWSARAPRVLEPRSVPPLHPPGAGRAPDRRPAAAGRVCGRLPDASAPLQVGERPVSPSCLAAGRTVREETRAKAQRTSVPSCRRGPTRTVSRLLRISRGTMHASPCRTGGRGPTASAPPPRRRRQAVRHRSRLHAALADPGGLGPCRGSPRRRLRTALVAVAGWLRISERQRNIRTKCLNGVQGVQKKLAPRSLGQPIRNKLIAR